MEAKDLDAIQPMILEEDGDMLLLTGTNGVAGSAFLEVNFLFPSQTSSPVGFLRYVKKQIPSVYSFDQDSICLA